MPYLEFRKMSTCLEVHEVHEFLNLRAQHLDGLLINFDSVGLFVRFDLGINKCSFNIKEFKE